LIAALAELDSRRLYLAQGCSSLFTYCTQVLHLSEHAAYGRIEAARTARKWPVVIELIGSGSIHLTALTLLSRHLTTENYRDLLAAAQHKTKREIEGLVAALRPQPAVPSTVCKLPETRPVASTSDAPPPTAFRGTEPEPAQAIDAPTPALAFPARPAHVTPLAPERYEVQFTATRETFDKLRQAQDLLRHRVPSGDIAAIIDRALTALVTELKRTKHAATDRPRTGRPGVIHGRHIAAHVKREVWARDGGQCAFVGATDRCTERGFLEYHHVVPFADGGASTAGNIELRCRAHNAYEAERWFGVSQESLLRESRATY
jgi:5-methylcytosine-specific restriction endonuclease McrA